MRVTCPACGADMTLDALLQHDEARRAIATAMQCSPALAPRLMKYLGLFRPARRQLTMDRVAALLGEVLALIETGRIDRRGRQWAADRDAWCSALDTVIEHRDAGRLNLPLKSHGYLLEVLAGLAEKAEAGKEREHHARLARGERPAREAGVPVITSGPAAVAGALAALPERSEMPEEFKQQMRELGLLRPKRPATEGGA